MTDTERLAALEALADLVAAARREGIYEDDPDWRPIDERLARLGCDVDVASWQKVDRLRNGSTWDDDTLGWKPPEAPLAAG